MPTPKKKKKGTPTDMRIAARFETPFDSWGAGRKQVNAFKEKREMRKGMEEVERLENTTTIFVDMALGQVK